MTKRIAIIGGGITGLALSHFLQRKNRYKIDLFEKSERMGGWIQSEEIDGQIIEKGPRMLRSQGSGHEILDLCLDLGIQERIIKASRACKTRMLVHDNVLESFPTSVFDFVKTRLGRKFLRGILPLLFKKYEMKEDVSISAFFESHTSKSFVQNFIDPLCRGIWANSPEHLSMKACLPQILNFLENKSFRSLFKRKKKSESFLFSLDQGLEQLILALREQCTANIHENTQVLQLKEHQDYIELITNERPFRVDRVFCCVPSHELQKILPEEDAAQVHLQKIKATSVLTCTFRYSTRLPRQAFGFLVPSIEDKELLGVVFDSCIFNDAYGQVTVMLARGHEEFSHDEIVELSQKKLKKYLPIDAQITHTKTLHAKNAIAQYVPGHLDTVATLERLFEPRRICIAGSSYYGVSVGDCVRSARLVQNNL